MCKENDALFGDSEFPASDSSLFKDSSSPPDYSVGVEMQWLRPADICDAAGGGEPMMIKDGFNPGDIKQGTLGDCWFLGSLLTLGTHPELLQNLIVFEGIEHGFAVF